MAKNVKKRVVKIDLNALKSIADLGLRRAYIFLGLGANAARVPELNTYELPGNFGIIIVPPPKDEREIKHAKKEFERWVVGNALRELFESHSLYLDKVYDVLLITGVSKRDISPSQRTKKYKIFERKGLYEKLNILRKEYKVKSQLNNHMRSINRARNCLTHNRGVVRRGDANNREKSKLTMKWRTLNYQYKGIDGKVEKITEAKMPFHLEKDAIVEMSIRNRQRSFRVGTLINLKPKDLNELCFTFYIANSEIFNSLISRLKLLGLLNKEN